MQNFSAVNFNSRYMMRRSMEALNDPKFGVKGTYCLVETVISEQDIAPSGEQLIILLGFRTTNKTNGQVEHSSQFSTTLVSTLDRFGRNLENVNLGGTGQGSQICTKRLASRKISRYIARPLHEMILRLLLQVKKVEFMESHTSSSSEVFQYLVLLHVNAGSHRGKVGVLDSVDRFRAGNMSGYVTVYSDLTDRAMANTLVMV